MHATYRRGGKPLRPSHLSLRLERVIRYFLCFRVCPFDASKYEVTFANGSVYVIGADGKFYQRNKKRSSKLIQRPSQKISNFWQVAEPWRLVVGIADSVSHFQNGFVLTADEFFNAAVIWAPV